MYAAILSLHCRGGQKSVYTPFSGLSPPSIIIHKSSFMPRPAAFLAILEVIKLFIMIDSPQLSWRLFPNRMEQAVLASQGHSLCAHFGRKIGHGI